MSNPEDEPAHPAAIAFILLMVMVSIFGTYAAGTIKGYKDATEEMEKQAVMRGFGNWYDGVFTWEGDDGERTGNGGEGEADVSDMSVL